MKTEFLALKIMQFVQVVSSIILGMAICMLFADGVYLTTATLTILAIICVVSVSWGINERIEYIKIFGCKEEIEDEDVAGFFEEEKGF